MKLVSNFKEEGKAAPVLIEQFTNLDNKILQSMIAAANAVGRKDHGYQRSEDFINAGREINLGKGISSCTHNGMEWARAVERLANLTKSELDGIEELIDAVLRSKAHEAREELKKMQLNDGERRIKWLERRAEERFLEDPREEIQQHLRQMISAAKQKQMQRKLSHIIKPEYKTMTHIEIPNEEWYHSAENIFEVL